MGYYVIFQTFWGAIKKANAKTLSMACCCFPINVAYLERRGMRQILSKTIFVSIIVYFFGGNTFIMRFDP